MRRHYLILALLAVLLIVFPRLVHSPYYHTVLIMIAVNVILALSLNLVMGYTGQISLGHAAFFGLGAYATMILTSPQAPLQAWLKEMSWLPEFIPDLAGLLQKFTAAHMVIAALIAAGFTCLIALLLGLPTLRLRGHYLAMATLGLGIIINIFFKEESALTGGPSGMGVPRLAVGGFEVTPNSVIYYYLVWGVTGLLTLLTIHLVHSRLGRALRAIREDELAAAACGVPVMRLKLMVFSLSAVYASLAGTLYAHYITHINPSPFGFMFSVKLVTMVVIGGMGSIWGPLLGAAVLTTLPQFLAVFQEYEMLIFGLILVVTMMTAPQGLAGLARDLSAKLRPEKT